VSPVEQRCSADVLPNARVMVLSNIHEPIAGGKPYAEREGCLFIGGFQHPPNTTPCSGTAREILPRLRERCRRAHDDRRQRGAGADQGAGRRRLRRRGYVPDVGPYFCSARVSISPLRYGAGGQGQGQSRDELRLPVVATPPSIEGMHLSPARTCSSRHGRGVRRRDRALYTTPSCGHARRRRSREHPRALSRATSRAARSRA
jgi:hypothetical protein